MDKRRLLIRLRTTLLSISVVFFLSVLAVGLVRDHRVELGFVALQPGETEQQVLAQLGKPSHITRSCPEASQRMVPQCDHLFYWRSSFAPIAGSDWLVFFDAAGTVKTTSREIPK